MDSFLNFGRGGVDAEGKTDALMGGAAWAHGGDDVRGIGGIGEAGGPAAGADVGLVKHEEEGFRFDAVEGDIRRVGEACGGGTVPFGIRNGRENAVFQFIAQWSDGPVVIGAFFRGMSGSGAEADEVRDVFRSATTGAS